TTAQRDRSRAVVAPSRLGRDVRRRVRQPVVPRSDRRQPEGRVALSAARRPPTGMASTWAVFVFSLCEARPHRVYGLCQGKTGKRSGSEHGVGIAGLEEVATPLAFPDMQLPN